MLTFFPEQEAVVVGVVHFSSPSLSLLALTALDTPVKDKGFSGYTGSCPRPIKGQADRHTAPSPPWDKVLPTLRDSRTSLEPHLALDSAELLPGGEVTEGKDLDLGPRGSSH